MKKTKFVHRWMYEIIYGPIPKNMQIDHLCRVRSCCNPKHLELVTPAENSRRGSFTKLNVEQVKEIKRRVKNTNVCDLARQLGLNKGHISDIKNGKSWRDI